MNIYIYIKNIIFFLIPKKYIIKYEFLLRRIFSVFYIGSKYKCNVCNKKFRLYLDFNNDKKCPFCGSLSRDRRLLSIFEEHSFESGIKILDFSPSRSLYRKFKTDYKNYLASDFSGNFYSDVKFDITNIPINTNSFDIVICYHVLEHVEKDNNAISELFRITKKGGICFIQTPFKEGDSYENDQIVNQEERKIHFGQEDHVRVYSVNGLCFKLQQIGFQVSIKIFNDSHESIFGFANHETILIAKKQ